MKNLLLLFLLIVSAGLSAQGIESLKDIKSKKPFEVSGAVSANLGLYSVSGIDQRTSPFSYGITGRLNFKFYGFSVPVYASIRDHSLNYGGALPRLRINPQYKWVKLHLGDTFMEFNPYTLAGRTVRGVGLELTPGILRVKGLYGKVEDLRSFQDSTLLGTTFVPTYSRKTMAASIGVGNDRTYFDIHTVRTWDRLDSLNGERVVEDFTRQANTVVGTSFRFQLGRSTSITSNTGYSFATDNLDAFGGNTLIGENPLTGSLLEANISSYRSYAGDVALTYDNRYFSVNGKVRYVQPYFQPLSVAFINTDLINYTVGGSFGLFRRKLMFSGNVGIQQNNLSGNKLSTSNQLILNVMSSFRLTKALSGSATYANFSQNFEARLIQINDLYTYAVDNKIMSLNLNHRTKFREKTITTSARVGRNTFSTIDDSETVLSEYQNFFTGVSLGIGDPTKHWNVRTSLDYRTYKRMESNTANYGISINGNKGFFDNKVRLMLNTNYSFNDLDGLREGTVWRNGFNVSYAFKQKSSIGIRLNHIVRTNIIRPDFSEIRAAVSYSQRF